ncbi:MAG: hypothetical protein AMJ84_05455 [Acidithiobacillales bacterium SM23_46]|nr:MAG: hypothetical protein AMJ84_05455 [Acidithiobacillales bacterium SM23_46]KPL27970.1 MAG: hypothetical protein AMJ72_05900 [Acidithiobacillales bacterium SM1_46]
MYVSEKIVDVTTDASGNATAYTDPLNGPIFSIQYVKPGSGGFADGVDFNITLERTGRQLWVQENVNASAEVRPRAATHKPDGTVLTYDDTYEVRDPIVAAGERIKIAVSNGGDTKQGTFHIQVG